MKQIIFDFSTLADRDAFYYQFAQQFQLDEAFGNNLDALWDVLTGEIELPVNIVSDMRRIIPAPSSPLLR